jgi:hypothetical protein
MGLMQSIFHFFVFVLVFVNAGCGFCVGVFFFFPFPTTPALWFVSLKLLIDLE